MSDGARVTVAVGVTGHPLPFDVSWQEAAAAATGRLAAVARALRLPVDLEVQAIVDPAPVDDGAPAFEMRIGGADARLRRGVPRPEHLDALVEMLARDLVANRALLVVPEVARRLRRSAEAGSPPAMSEEHWLLLLRECAALCTPVDHVRLEAGASVTPAGWWPHLEDAVAFQPSLGITVPSGYFGGASAADFADASNRLGDLVYDTTGVILPPVAFREAGDAGPEQLEIQVRTVPVPVSPGGGDAIGRLAGALRPWLHCFVTEPTIAVRVGGVRERFPRLVDGVRLRYGLPFITRVCRTLVRDGLSVRDMRTVLEGLLDIREPGTADEVARIVFHAPTGTPRTVTTPADADDDARGAVDCVRRWCRRMVSVTHWQAGSLQMRLLTTEVEQSVRDGAFTPGSAPQRALLRQMSAASDPILTTVDVRRRLADAIALERPDVAVLCYQELLPEANITSTQRIALR